jgi:hypothetical protein
MLFGKSNVPVDVSQMEEMKPGCEFDSELKINLLIMRARQRTHFALSPTSRVFAQANYSQACGSVFPHKFPRLLPWSMAQVFT